MKKFYLTIFLVTVLFAVTNFAQTGILTPEWYEEQGIYQDTTVFGSIGPHERIIKEIPAGGILLIPDSTDNRVMAFDPVTGDLIDANFIPSQDDYLSTPIHIILCGEAESLLITDQIRDIVQRFSFEGDYLGIFAPQGGADTSILDNIRGMFLRNNGNYLVTVAGGGNNNAIAEFDPDGAYLGNFITAGLGGLNSPWCIIYREAFQDYLITGGSSNAVHRYDADGLFIEIFASPLNFPEQIYEMSNGNILVATFSSPSGVYEFDAQGDQIGFYNPVTGLRGVYELGNGNILTTNGSGVFEINRDGQLVDTKISGVSARFISFVSLDDPDLFSVTLYADPDDIGAVLTGAGDYAPGAQVDIEVSLSKQYTFVEWTGSADDIALLDDPYSMATFFTMPGRNVVFTAVFQGDGPDASISASDISFSPELPEPGDTVQINARIYNLGEQQITSGNANFYYSLEPGVDLQLIETQAFGPIDPSDFVDITVFWTTDLQMDPRIYILTVTLTDIEPDDINPDNNTATLEIPLPVELAYFNAWGLPDRVEVQWMTITETDNLGFNLYRLRGDKVNSFISYTAVKLNESIIPGQGTSSNPRQYEFTDHVKYGSNYIYILECISTEGISTEEYRTRIEWIY